MVILIKSAGGEQETGGENFLISNSKVDDDPVLLQIPIWYVRLGLAIKIGEFVCIESELQCKWIKEIARLNEKLSNICMKTVSVCYAAIISELFKN